MIFYIPMRVVSEANLREHWRKRHARHKLIEKTLWVYFKNAKIELPCEIMLTRIAPRPLDEDNLIGGAMKHIRDTIADFLIPGKAPGRADADKRLKWLYRQDHRAPREYALEIEITYCPDQR